MTRIAAIVAENKKKYPHLYCQGSPGCLWRIHTTRGDSPCPRHPVQSTASAPSAARIIHDEGLPVPGAPRAVAVRR